MHHLQPCILNAVVVPYSFDEAVNSIKYNCFVVAVSQKWHLLLRPHKFCVSTVLHIHNEPYEYIPTA